VFTWHRIEPATSDPIADDILGVDGIWLSISLCLLSVKKGAIAVPSAVSWDLNDVRPL
jgi:hypothetical protein